MLGDHLDLADALLDVALAEHRVEEQEGHLEAVLLLELGEAGVGHLDMHLGALDLGQDRRGCEVELATVPDPVPFLADPALGTAKPMKPGQWRIATPSGSDTDEIIHTITTTTLAAGGRIRRIGVAEPDLDDLFAQYILQRDGHA